MKEEAWPWPGFFFLSPFAMKMVFQENEKPNGLLFVITDEKR